MKLLTTTRDGQGKRSNDFCFAEEGEIAYFGSRAPGLELMMPAAAPAWWATGRRTRATPLRWADAVRGAVLRLDRRAAPLDRY